MPSALFDHSAPFASLDWLKARAAPTLPRAQPGPLGSLPWPQALASGRPKVEDFPLSTSRRCLPPEAVSFEQAVPNQLIATLAGRQEYKDALRDAGGVPPDGMPQMVSAKDLKKMAESPG